MTTKLNKAVSRKTGALDGGREIVITLYPGDVIGFRLSRCHKEFQTTVGACYSLAVKQQRATERKQKQR